jgi:protein SCO1/2
MTLIRKERASHTNQVKSANLILALSLVCVLCALPSSGALASKGQAQNQPDAHRHGVQARAVDENNPNKPEIPDVACLDQDGKPLHFRTDLVKGKVVVINFIFTSCNYICPRIGESFARLQTILGQRVGKDVYLISVSTDPLTDTPERLKAWATRMHAKPGWTLVTGEKTEIDKLLKVMTGDPSGQTTHSPVLLIGNETNGAWLEASAFDNPARLVQKIDQISK